MPRKELKVIAISNSQSQNGAYALILEVLGTQRRIPIIIGAFEAQAIALKIEGMSPSRPLTHDLIHSIFGTFDIKMHEVYINKFVDGVFHSVLVCELDGKILNIDSRTSDSVALAVRFDCPIYCDVEIINKTSISMESLKTVEEDADSVNDELEEYSYSLDDLSEDELEELLKSFVESEDYEQASLVRDALNRKRNA